MPGLRLQLSARVGDAWQDVHLDSSFEADLGESEGPYEVLLHAALTGDHRAFRARRQHRRDMADRPTAAG